MEVCIFFQPTKKKTIQILNDQENRNDTLFYIRTFLNVFSLSFFLRHSFDLKWMGAKFIYIVCQIKQYIYFHFNVQFIAWF